MGNGVERKQGGFAEQAAALENRYNVLEDAYERLRADYEVLRRRASATHQEMLRASHERDVVRQQNTILVANITALRDQVKTDVLAMQDQCDAMFRGLFDTMNTAFESMTRQIEESMGIPAPGEPKERGHMYGKVLSQARENAVAAGEAPYDDPLAAIAADLDQRRQ